MPVSRQPNFLRQQGFTVETFAIGDNPAADNTVRAVYGSGHPIIGILGEYDALDGLGRKQCLIKSPLPGRDMAAATI